MVYLLITLCLILITPCYAALYECAASLPGLKYDFIIVGAGTAGNVIANRLTEDLRTTVLVLEAGISNAGQLGSEVPFIGVSALTAPNPINWNYTTVPEAGLKNRTRDYPRGFVLGGSSSINGMVYTRGSSDDYDRYAKLTGDEGWSWDSLQPYILKNELWTEPTDQHNTAGQFNPAVHGFHGINSVSLPGYSFPTDSKVITTTQQFSNDFPFNLDMNSGKPLGVGWAQATINEGVRSSSATSYLAPKYLNRPNLHVLINARVTKLVKTSTGKQPLTFQQVEFTQDGPTGKRLVAQADKEVILSAGATNTPFLLMHSGIGDTQELSKVGIPTLLNIPSVGKNSSDHPVATISWFVNSTDTFDELRNLTLFNEFFATWNATHGSLFGTNGLGQIGWKRIPNNSTIFQKFPDLSAGPNSAHIELSFANGGAEPIGNGFTIGVIIVSPGSRGSVGIASNDPFQQPLINTGTLTSDFDIFALKEGIKLSKKFIAAPIWKGCIMDLQTTSLADTRSAATATAITAYHLTGTAAMTAPNAGYGVVNPDLRVKGVNGLRIVDASIFPFIPSGHTQAPTCIIAERAADIIKLAWN
ncbi:GMC oxidoreductase [Sphaerobolus stellatus SS14]|nr:GMC oxidoreductase [Sphaerobolus stellatus SS14]